MILVDTSVLINYLRGKETNGALYFDGILQNDMPFVINQYIYQEILQGAKDEREFLILKEYLSDIPLSDLRLGIQSFENAASR